MKVFEFDDLLNSHEEALYEASKAIKKVRVEESATCDGCEHRHRTFASPPCSLCDVTGTMFEAAKGEGELNDDDS